MNLTTSFAQSGATVPLFLPALRAILHHLTSTDIIGSGTRVSLCSFLMRLLRRSWIVYVLLVLSEFWLELTYKKKDKKVIARNIEAESRSARVLYIWTDCDREGEYIGTEIRDIALKTNSRLEVKRAKFSNIEREYVDRPWDLVFTDIEIVML